MSNLNPALALSVGLLKVFWKLGMGIGRVVKVTPRTHYYPLGRFVIAYLGTLVLSLTASAIHATVACAVYFVAGYALNRYIFPHLEWNTFEFSLGDIARVKLLAFLTWPIMYPPFFVQLAIIRYL